MASHAIDWKSQVRTSSEVHMKGYIGIEGNLAHNKGNRCSLDSLRSINRGNMMVDHDCAVVRSKYSAPSKGSQLSPEGGI